MFREMRLKEDNALTREQAMEILENAAYGVMAVDGDDNYPYAVPVNYAVKGDVIYFHGAPEGHKVDAVKRNAKVSICAISQADIVPDAYNCLYRSAIAFGKVRMLEGDEKKQAFEAIIEKFSKGFEEGGRAYMEDAWDDVMAFAVEIEHVTGKMGTP